MGKNLDLNLVMVNKVCQSQFVISRLFHCSCSGSVDKKHKRSTESNYGTAPVDPCRLQNRGSHDYLRAYKGSRRMSRPLIQDSSVRVLFPRYKGNLT